MERILLKMAGQLNAYDEASLMALWNKYAELVESFEPSRRWEEAALVLSFIQAVHLKNQLFNHHLALGTKPEGGITPLSDSLPAWARPEKSASGKKTPGKPAAASSSESGGESGAESGGGAKSPSSGANSSAAGRTVKKVAKVLHFRGSKGEKPV